MKTEDVNPDPTGPDVYLGQDSVFRKKWTQRINNSTPDPIKKKTGTGDEEAT